MFEVGQRQRIYVEPDLPAGEDERLRLLAFSTPDLEALAAHLTAKGVAVTRVPRHGGGRRLAVTDPDGHPLAFVQRDWPPEDQQPSGPASRASRRCRRASCTPA